MTSKYDTYTSPLAERNASPEMLRLWSARHKFNTWRRIWLAVAEAQHELGLPVTKEQVEELRAVVTRANPDGSVGITDDEIRAAEKYERELRHDVMAHVHALGDSCPKAKGIIHLGMTSQDVVCNADGLLLQQSLRLIRAKLARGIVKIAEQAARHIATPTLGFTHYQPAQPVTVGRRFAMQASDLWLSLRRMDLLHSFAPEWRTENIGIAPLRGIRGATGTQASFQALFQIKDRSRDTSLYPLPLVQMEDDLWSLEAWVTEELFAWGLPEFDKGQAVPAGVYPDCPTGTSEPEVSEPYKSMLPPHTCEVKLVNSLVTGQTYPRVIDTFILADLASTASVLHKIATDIRLLCNRKELDEPFETKQIGSSAMPYKRNPMRCERICGLTRFVMNLVGNAYDTAATQWLERTLDDSSNRRLSLPEAFLALDGALDLMHNVASGLIVHEATVRKNLMAELPFMATENILMECVKLGGDRQEFHELIRAHAQTAGLRVKDEGEDNDLIDRLKNDKAFWPASRGGTHGLKGELNWGDSDSATGGLLDPMKYIGRSVEQTERFIKEVVEPLRAQYGEAIEKLGQSGPRV
ncbi:MAG: adenylosuccinate lyase [Pyrinomonadaceae bacterium]|nr:adenylosuccinate lyase [Phycisphaerales bacterium]